MLKKILPAVTGAIGFAIGGPMGASIGAGLGSAIRGDNPANIATSALMGFGLGSFATSAGLFGTAAPASQFGGTTASSAIKEAQTVEQLKAALGGDPTKNLAKMSAREALGQPSVFQRGAEAFGGMSTLAKGALGLGAIGALSSIKEDEDEVTPIEGPPEPGSVMPLDLRMPDVAYATEYGSATPTYRSLAEGGDVIDTETRSLNDVVNNFPRKVGQIDGPGTEKSDDIPAMLSDGEFVMTAQAVRGLGALNGANKDDTLEQRRKGAKMMYEMMDKFESKVA